MCKKSRTAEVTICRIPERTARAPDSYRTLGSKTQCHCPKYRKSHMVVHLDIHTEPDCQVSFLALTLHQGQRGVVAREENHSGLRHFMDHKISTSNKQRTRNSMEEAKPTTQETNHPARSSQVKHRE